MSNKIFTSLMVLMSIFLVASCSQKNEDEQYRLAISKVLEHQFTGPDQEFVDLIWNPKYKTVVNNKEENHELDKYIAEVYGPFFTESGLGSFMATFGTQFPTYAHDSGYKLSLKDVTIEQSENIPYRYTFIAKVGYKKNGEEEKSAIVEGEVSFSTKEEGKISVFKYVNDNGLSDDLRN